jgi:hypothetical protein
MLVLSLAIAWPSLLNPLACNRRPPFWLIDPPQLPIPGAASQGGRRAL